MQIRHLSLFVLLAAVPASAAEPHAHGEHRTHRHGTATMQVALDGAALHVRITGPAENVLGFEHAPRTQAQRKTLQRAEERLRRTEELFTLPATAGCTAQAPRVEIKLPPPGSREQHSDFEAEYRWQCHRPAELHYVEIGLFQAFPHLKELHAQAITDRGQKSARLKHGATRLALIP